MAKVDVGWIWHRRLAHVNMGSFQSLLKGDHVQLLKSHGLLMGATEIWKKISDNIVL